MAHRQVTSHALSLLKVWLIKQMPRDSLGYLSYKLHSSRGPNEGPVCAGAGRKVGVHCSSISMSDMAFSVRSVVFRSAALSEKRV